MVRPCDSIIHLCMSCVTTADKILLLVAIRLENAAESYDTKKNHENNRQEEEGKKKANNKQRNK